MGIRRVLVPMTGAEADRAALSAGFQVAAAQGAHLDAIYLRPDPAEAVPYVGDPASAAVIEDIYQAAKKAADNASSAARQMFETAARSAGIAPVTALASAHPPSARFLDEMGGMGRSILRHARLADLVVTADLSKNPTATAAFETVLMGARRPVLTLPGGAPVSWGRNVLIGWSGSLEAGFALMSALPLLKSAQSITILSNTLPDDVPPASEVVSFLALHGLTAGTATFETKGKSVGAALIETAASLGADFIVMGGYGHSRLREFILGGVTRHMISHATTAVLMAH